MSSGFLKNIEKKKKCLQLQPGGEVGRVGAAIAVARLLSAYITGKEEGGRLLRDEVKMISFHDIGVRTVRS